MTITTFGAAAALAVAVGFGGVGAAAADHPPVAPSHASSSVAPTPGAAGAGTHHATLAGCISDLNC
jgi:hypothetical protein